jgi:hypothetical protein
VSSGMVACLMQKHPLRPMMDVLQAVQQSGDRYMTPDTGYGYGLASGCKADTLLSILDAVEDPSTAMQLVAYPNPGQGSLLLLAPSAIREVELLDPQGRTVLRAAGGPSQVQVRTDGLPSGIYLVRVALSDGRVVSTRWVKA